MYDTGKRYHIVDTAGHFFKLNDKNNLVVAKSSSEATLFTLKEANDRIGTGKKARFYSFIEAPQASLSEQESNVAETYEAPEYDTIEKPTMFDSLQNNWEEILSNLCYMSSHMSDYQSNLNQMLSDVDKEICDLMHYLEFTDLDDNEMLKVAEMLKERRCHRRQIKDEME